MSIRSCLASKAVLRIVALLSFVSLVVECLILRPPVGTSTSLENEDFFTDHLLSYQPLPYHVEVASRWQDRKTGQSDEDAPMVLDMPMDVNLLFPSTFSTTEATIERRSQNVSITEAVTKSILEEKQVVKEVEEEEDDEDYDDEENEDIELPPGYLTRLRTNLTTALMSPKTDRRMFFVSPFRRLMMAYLAPRILKLQMNMLFSTLVGEVGRKVLSPLMGLDKLTGLRQTITSPSNGGASSSSTFSSSPSPVMPKLSEMSELAGLLSSLQGGGGQNSLNSLLQQLTQPAQLQQKQSPGQVAPVSVPRSSSRHIYLATVPSTITVAPSKEEPAAEDDPEEDVSSHRRQTIVPRTKTTRQKTKSKRLEQETKEDEEENEEKLQNLLQSFLAGIQSSPALVRQFYAHLEASKNNNDNDNIDQQLNETSTLPIVR